MIWLLWMLLVSCLLAGFALVMTLVNLGLYRRPVAEVPWSPDAAQARVVISVCVPARNEEANIEPCVRSLLGQTMRAIEILVYDDHSSDETPAILARLAHEDPRVKAIATAPLPEGWNGKQFACDRMGRAAEGEWLLFTDADVRFEPACCEQAFAAAVQLRTELLSTFPRQFTGSLAEILVVPLIHFILLGFLPIARMRNTLDPATSAGCGQFLLARRAAWLSAGGHAAFKDSMHDGIKMPRAFRKAGLRTDLFDGTELVSCRMYKGFSATWRGFAKNAYEGLGGPALLIFVTLFNAMAYLLPAATLLLGAAGLNGLTTQVMLAAAIAFVVAISHRFILAVRFRQSYLGAILHPIGIILMMAIQWWSFLLAVTGRRTWRGRHHHGSAATAATTTAL